MVGIHRPRLKKRTAGSPVSGSGGRKAKSANPAKGNPPKVPTGIRAAAIKVEIRELRALESKAFAARHGKTDFYSYLKAIYKTRDWTDSAGSTRSAKEVAAVCQVGARKNKSPIRTLIDATSSQDRQVKSEWAQALEYAIANKVRGNGFKKFVKQNGGVAGCAKKMAKLRKARLQARLQKRSQSKAP
jgi:hypothetical protein